MKLRRTLSLVILMAFVQLFIGCGNKETETPVKDVVTKKTVLPATPIDVKVVADTTPTVPTKVADEVKPTETAPAVVKKKVEPAKIPAWKLKEEAKYRKYLATKKALDEYNAAKPAKLAAREAQTKKWIQEKLALAEKRLAAAEAMPETTTDEKRHKEGAILLAKDKIRDIKSLSKKKKLFTTSKGRPKRKLNDLF